MKKILTIIGARPQIIKAAAVSRAVKAWNNAHPDKAICETILHTGQHYDDNMSAVFFRELGVPEPDVNLHVGSASHGEQTARMLSGIEQVLMRERYDGVLIYGDTNSTLAGALAASKLSVPIFHVEAGLRSWNRQMPEEINRIVADELSSLLFTPTSTATDNLAGAEWGNVIQVGDVMFDNALYYSAIADENSSVLHRLGLTDKPFALATIHRQGNTDCMERMECIMRALLTISEQTPVVLPLHPRTRAKLPREWMEALNAKPQLIVTDPVSFLDMVCLEKHASIVLTDSGGVQKEAFFYGKPCIILRGETEWVEIVDAGAAVLADADEQRILVAFNAMNGRAFAVPDLYGDGHAADKIVAAIADFAQ